MEPTKEKTRHFVPVGDFGKDHWSLMGYVEAVVTDKGMDRRLKNSAKDFPPNVGQLNYERCRINKTKHPLLFRLTGVSEEFTRWKPDWGTRLSGYWGEDEGVNPERQLPDHDDFDCLNDLEEAGFVEVLSAVNGFVRLTEEGSKVGALLRQHKQAGGHFADFRLPADFLKETTSV